MAVIKSTPVESRAIDILIQQFQTNFISVADKDGRTTAFIQIKQQAVTVWYTPILHLHM